MTVVEWRKEERTVTLTNEDWSKLDIFLLLTRNFRKNEEEIFKRGSQEKNEDGSLKYPNAVADAEFYKELNIRLEEIRKIIAG